MLDHPQDAYNLARERQYEMRKSAKREKTLQVSVVSNGKKISTTFKEWMTYIRNLRKIRFEIQFILK